MDDAEYCLPQVEVAPSLEDILDEDDNEEDDANGIHQDLDDPNAALGGMVRQQLNQSIGESYSCYSCVKK